MSGVNVSDLPGVKLVKLQKNLILIALVLVLVLELVFFVFLTREKKEEIKSPRMAILSLEPSQGEYKVGEEFEVRVILDTGEYETDATDIRLSFDPQILNVTKIIPGEIYDDYPAKRVDQEREVIIVNGITALDKTYKGKDVFATIFFKGLKPGKTNLIFEFTPFSTTDSNVVASKIAKDVLGEVEGGSIEIY